MARNKVIINNSTTHALVRVFDTGGNGTVSMEMTDIGGTNGTSVVAIESIDYSFFQSDKEFLIDFSDNSTDATIYELYGQGQIGSPGRRVSSDLNAGGGQDRVLFKFAANCVGSALVLFRKVSGF